MFVKLYYCNYSGDGRMQPMGSNLASRGLHSRQPVAEEIRFRIRSQAIKDFW
jgi:hypothetical protein